MVVSGMSGITSAMFDRLVGCLHWAKVAPLVKSDACGAQAAQPSMLRQPCPPRCTGHGLLIGSQLLWQWDLQHCMRSLQRQGLLMRAARAAAMLPSCRRVLLLGAAPRHTLRSYCRL